MEIKIRHRADLCGAVLFIFAVSPAGTISPESPVDLPPEPEFPRNNAKDIFFSSLVVRKYRRDALVRDSPEKRLSPAEEADIFKRLPGGNLPERRENIVRIVENDPRRLRSRPENADIERFAVPRHVVEYPVVSEEPELIKRREQPFRVARSPPPGKARACEREGGRRGEAIPEDFPSPPRSGGVHIIKKINHRKLIAGRRQ